MGSGARAPGEDDLGVLKVCAPAEGKTSGLQVTRRPTARPQVLPPAGPGRGPPAPEVRLPLSPGLGWRSSPPLQTNRQLPSGKGVSDHRPAERSPAGPQHLAQAGTQLGVRQPLSGVREASPQWGMPPGTLKVRGRLRGALIFWGGHSKLHKLGGLKQRKCILSRFWRPPAPSGGSGAGPSCLSQPLGLQASLGLWPRPSGRCRIFSWLLASVSPPLSLPLPRPLVAGFRAHQIITSARRFFQVRSHCTFWALGRGHTWHGGHYPPYKKQVKAP